MQKKLAGKVALVTGGSRGIGAAAARALADEGTDVVISFAASAARADDVLEQLEQKGVRAASFKADQGDPEQVAELIDSVVERFGRLDILVNNAGVFVPGEIDDPKSKRADIERQHAINFVGTIAAIRAAVMVMNEGGRIITVGSALSARVGWKGRADYAATTSALVGYTKGAARDLGSRGVTINVVQPGFVDTEMNPASSDAAALFKASTALGRYARPEEIAAAIVFLASPDASYITGTVLTVDGGYGA